VKSIETLLKIAKQKTERHKLKSASSCVIQKVFIFMRAHDAERPLICHRYLEKTILVAIARSWFDIAPLSANFSADALYSDVSKT